MENNLPLLQVRMFGKERITYGDKAILLGRNSITKTLKLLLILLYNGEEGISRNKLIEQLYEREELSDVSNNLRVTMHRLKKLLVDDGLPEHEYIVSQGGMYYWSSPMKTELDVVLFRNLVVKARAELDMEKKAEMLKQACNLYKGDFLQKLSGEAWVLSEGIMYKDLYAEALTELCDYLKSQREYEEAIRYVELACELYPFDEWQAIKIDCLIGMNHYKEALKEYEATAKLLFEELGITPSTRMMEQFQDMSKHISNRPQVITEIKGGLQEETEERGAFYCTVPGFRDAYRVIRRGMERTGQSVFLLVCTLTDSKGRPLENSDRLDAMAEELFGSIRNSLRRCDSFTKYNQSQFLVMLMGTNEENCQIVIDRIRKTFSKEHKTWAQNLNCTVSSLYDYDVEVAASQARLNGIRK